jgi:hypothetical protein
MIEKYPIGHTAIFVRDITFSRGGYKINSIYPDIVLL